MLLTKYSDISPGTIEKINKVINPYNACVQPTIVNCWLNKTDASRFFVSDTYLLAYIDYEDHPFWTLSTRYPVEATTIREIASDVYKNDASFDGTFRYVSEESVATLQDDPAQFHRIIPEEVEHYPYIYDLEKCANLIGSSYSDIRRGMKLYRVANPASRLIFSENLTDSRISIDDISEFFHAWQSFETEGSRYKSHEELQAIKILLDKQNSKMFEKLYIYTLFSGEELVGISICEIIDESYALNHFHKAKLSIPYASMFLFFEVAKQLHAHGVNELNYQDDYAIVGLRQFKNKLRPKKQEKLFSIQKDYDYAANDQTKNNKTQ